MTDPVVMGSASPKVICLVIHGRGQTQGDMVRMVVGPLDCPDVRFVLPKSDGLGWYDARAIDPLSAVTRAQMAAGFAQFDAILAAERAGNPGVPVMVAGFSQGACMALEFTLRGARPDGALCLFTGCRVGTKADDLPLADLTGLPVYASCGNADPWIPAAAYHDMLGDLTRAGARLRTDMFPGRPHDVTATERAVLRGMLDDLGAGRVPFDKGPA